MNAADVREAAAGRWSEVLVRLRIRAESLTGKHGPCPGCGGSDRFRFDDLHGRGTWICGGGGEAQSGDGFALLQHTHGWGFRQALRAVATALGLPAESIRSQPRHQLGTTPELEAAANHELSILALTLGRRVNEREMAKSRAFRDQNPEWRSEPLGHWEREIQAARRLTRLIPAIYPELTRRTPA